MGAFAGEECTQACGMRPLAVVLLLMSMAVGCGESPEGQLPPELMGRWTSSAPKYEDRFFEIRPDRTVVFGLGSGQIDVAPITDVELVRDGQLLTCHVSHLSDIGDVYRFSISYRPSHPGQLFLTNQPNVPWRKEKP